MAKALIVAIWADNIRYKTFKSQYTIDKIKFKNKFQLDN